MVFKEIASILFCFNMIVATRRLC